MLPVSLSHYRIDSELGRGGMGVQDGFAHTFLAQTVLFSGDYDDGEEITQRVLASDPANLYSNLFAPMSAIYRNDLAAMTDRVKRAVHIVGPDPLLDSYQREFGSAD